MFVDRTQAAQVGFCKCGSTLVTLPRNVTPYRDSANGARDRVTYQKLVTRSRYGLVRCAVGIWLSHQRDDTVTAGASVDVQRHAARPHCHDTVLRYAVMLQVWTHLYTMSTGARPPCVKQLGHEVNQFYLNSPILFHGVVIN